jgi:hypothetical protein
MRYTPPQNVTSPQDFVKNVRVIHDGGEKSFSLALLEWESETCIGIRWNIARKEWEDPTRVSEEHECLGMPSSRGYPVWFILPDDISDGRFNLSSCILDFKNKLTHF